MTTPIDIYRTAHLLVGQHGDSALVYAALRADELMGRGDENGKAVWARIIGAIHDLQIMEPSERTN